MITSLIIKYYTLVLRKKLLESVRGNDKIFVTVIDEIIRSNSWNNELESIELINNTPKDVLVKWVKVVKELLS